MKIRLRSILFAAFTLVSIVPVVFLAFWVQNSALEKEVQAVEEKHLLLARNLTGALSRYAIDVRKTFFTACDLLNDQDTLPEQLSHLLIGMNIDLVARLDLETQSIDIIAGHEINIPADLFKSISPELTVIAAAEVGSIIYTRVKPNRNGKPMLYLLYRSHGNRLIIGAVETGFIVDVQKQVTFGRKGHAAIVDHTGRILAHPKPAWQLAMKDISKIKPVSLMMAGETGVTTFYSPALKADMIAGYAAVPEVGWGVMIPQPYDELVERAGDVRLVAFGIASLGIAVATIISWWLAGIIAGPIRAVVKSARDLTTSGTVQITESHISGAKELKELVTTFNAMANDVQAAKHELEERVTERTRELNEEILERIKIENRIRYMANHDNLTGLPNRALLIDRLQMSLAESRRNAGQTALLFLDLDGFKPVNDEYGHHIGDIALQLVAKKVNTVTREIDTVARYGGDEFAVIVNRVEDIKDIVGITNKIIDTLSEPLVVEGHTIQLGGSIGVSLSSDGSASPDHMLSEADFAMYKAKKQGGNAVCYANSK